ncbi:hypothetical protein [Streptomyces violens]|uniref:hypothetical protein n=1 Tax=Streptomyces violens TaxID=66377 RepID=UPI0012FE931A|nr:hypothetical protein [Streptomyces violens]
MTPNEAANAIQADPPLGAANEPLLLHAGELVVTQDGQRFPVEGVIRWEWLPTPQITYEFSTDSPELNTWDITEEFTVEIPDTVTIGSEILSDNEDSKPLLRASGRMKNTTVGTGEDIRRVTFHVPNMPDVNGHWLSEPGGRSWNGRLAFRAADWMFILDSRPDRRAIRDQLRDRGGYATTHTGELTRHDSTPMSQEEISSAFHLLRCVLSFSFGRQITPCLGLGFNSGGEVAWRDWRVFHIRPWSGAHRLVDETRYSDLADIFSLVGDLWSDEFSRDLLSNAVHYYLEANDPMPVNIAVSAGQAALELMAYEKLVEENRTLTSSQYKSAAAHENISALLRTYSIDGQIPAILSRLKSAASGANPPCLTGPEVLTRMRNGVIHPSRHKQKFSTDAWVEAWELTCQYVSLAILGRIGFNGSYRDPVDPNKYAGVVSTVPWVNGQPGGN